MKFPAHTYTGFEDKHNVPINIDDIVRMPDGVIGKVVFRNAAYRIDVSPGYTGFYLTKNSSLLFDEIRHPNQLEVI